MGVAVPIVEELRAKDMTLFTFGTKVSSAAPISRFSTRPSPRIGSC